VFLFAEEELSESKAKKRKEKRSINNNMPSIDH
jgi:hypothetical protein